MTHREKNFSTLTMLSTSFTLYPSFLLYYFTLYYFILLHPPFLLHDINLLYFNFLTDLNKSLFSDFCHYFLYSEEVTGDPSHYFLLIPSICDRDLLLPFQISSPIPMSLKTTTDFTKGLPYHEHFSFLLKRSNYLNNFET